MLRRSPPSRSRRTARQGRPGPDDAARRREQRRLAQRAYRRRVDAGHIAVVVEIDSAVVEMLVAHRWLLDDDRDDRRKIGAALSAFAAEATKG